MSNIVEVGNEEIVTPDNNRKFGTKDKLGYLFGDLGNDFFFILVSAFLMVYYTDIFHINAGTVGILFLVARLWDAIADITWGRFIDTRKPTKHGKFKPWILRMSFPLVFSGVLMFVKIPGMSDNFYLIWAFITYIVWGTLYSTVNIPYGSMASVITSDPVERTSLSTFRSMGATIASLIITVGGPLIFFVDNKPDENRFLIGAILFGLLAISSYLLCYKLSVERVTPQEHQEQEKSLKITVKGLVKNVPLITILLASLIFMMCTMLINAVNVYLFKDYFESTTALSVLGFVNTFTTIMCMPFIKPLVKRFGKKEIASFGMFIAASVYISLYFLTDISATTFIVLAGIGLTGIGLFNIVVWAFVTDVIDYHEYLTGLREDGTVYSIYSFARKVGQAIAGGIGGAAIAAVGYSAAKGQQSTETLDGIYMLGTLVPGIIYFVVFVILMFFYPLSKKKTLDMAQQLQQKREMSK